MDYVTIYAYPKVWKIENKIYSIMNFRFPAPVESRLAVYALVLFGISYVLSNLIPALRAIPAVLRYLIFPGCIGMFLMKMKLDGKMPQRYFVSLLQYIGQLGRCCTRFESCPVKQPAVKLDWYCGRKLRTRRA